MAGENILIGSESTTETVSQPPALKQKVLKFLELFKNLLIKQWFILGIIFSILFAYALPDFGKPGGWIASQYTVKYGAVIIIFFFSGISLKSMSIATEAVRFRLHFLLQIVSLLVIPAIGYGIGTGLLHSSLDPDLVNGVIIALCMPTTVASNVVFTSQAGGNEAVALINAVSGNVIGIFVSPAWLTKFIGISGKTPYGKIVLNLVITVVVPFAIGQLVLYLRPNFVKWLKSRLNTGNASNILILMLVWTTFCRAFADHISVDARSTICTCLLILSLYLASTCFCFLIATFRPIKAFLRLDKKDVIAFTICASNKTLALGMPIIFDVFKNSPRAGVMSLPLLMYHVTQILFGSLFVKPMSHWIERPDYAEWPGRRDKNADVLALAGKGKSWVVDDEEGVALVSATAKLHDAPGESGANESNGPHNSNNNKGVITGGKGGPGDGEMTDVEQPGVTLSSVALVDYRVIAPAGVSDENHPSSRNNNASNTASIGLASTSAPDVAHDDALSGGGKASYEIHVGVSGVSATVLSPAASSFAPSSSSLAAITERQSTMEHERRQRSA